MAMKAKNPRCLVWAAVVTMFFVSFVGARAAEAKDGVFIHVTHGKDDPHRVLMALSMADIMAEDRDVLVYFDIQGVNVVLKDSDDLHYSHFASSKQQLSALPKKGVTLMACPGCLKAAGKTPRDLAPGVEVADKDRFFSFTKGRILTLDY
jgi:predicted peroxiredoxin